MLSLSVMSAGQGDYYADLAREDYYLEGGEPPGIWIGEGAFKLGLSGTVKREVFLDAFDGFKDGERLVQNAGRKTGKHPHRPGWDLTFSAPKTVSTLWSQVDKEIALEIQKAHFEAVQKAIQYLEENALWTRRGKEGKELERCHGVIATFEHGTSRAQDPQLHTHALLLNIGVCEDGKTRSLETRGIFLHKMVAGVLYRTELAHQLESRLRVTIEAKKSWFEIKGVSEGLADEFSTRRKEIEEALSKNGLKTSKAAEFAALDTRGVKEHVARSTLQENWLEVGKKHGWTREQARALVKGSQKVKDQSSELKKSCIKAIEKITEQNSYFTERDLLRQVAEAAQAFGASADAVQSSVKKHLKSSEISNIGTRLKEPVFTTKEMLGLESDLMKAVKEGARKPWKAAKDGALIDAMTSRPTMKEEQKEALKHITQKTGEIACVTGMAGTGKTFMLDATREAIEASGNKVIGASLSGKAAQGLEEGTGIKSSTLASLILRLQNGYLKLDEKTVLIVDEAGMVGTRQMLKLVNETRKAGSKLVLVGDEKQLQPIEAGGPFGAISKEIGTSELTDIIRQGRKEQAWQRQAIKDFAYGKATEALKEFAERGFVSVKENRESAKETLLTKWKPEGLSKPEDNLIVAATNADAKDLNRKIQDLRKEEGNKKSFASLDGEKFFEDDRILFTRNSSAIGVKNGSLGTVISANNKKLTCLLDNGEERSFSLKDYPHVKLGYAVTTHKAQGVTVNNVFILTDERMQNRELTYVQASRAKNEAYFFTTESEAGEELTDLATTMERTGEKKLAIDFGKDNFYRSPEARKKQMDPDLYTIQRDAERARAQSQLGEISHDSSNSSQSRDSSQHHEHSH